MRAATRTEPNAAAVERLNRNYEIYKSLYPALRPAMNVIGEK